MTPRAVTRRTFLQRAFAFSAAASLTGCGSGVSLITGQPSVTTAPPKGAADVLMLGDWGWAGSGNQSLVASAMQGYASKMSMKAAGLLMLGDNFYGALPGGVNSGLWETKFEQMYPEKVFNCPAYAVAGNHDYQYGPQSKVAAELAYAATGASRWTMPATYYRFVLPAKNPLVTILAVDSNMPNEPANPPPPDPSFFTPTEQQAAAELAWLEAELAKPLETPFLMVMGHHPVYSNGVFGDNATLVRNWDPLFRQYGVHLYVAGHNHDLEHLEFAGHPTSFVGSGGGGAWLTAEGDRVESTESYFGESHGFTHMRVEENLMTVRHINQDGEVLHGFNKTPGGAVTILT
jgi:tartrate-resistant acid phosphatase type 5